MAKVTKIQEKTNWEGFAKEQSTEIMQLRVDNKQLEEKNTKLEKTSGVNPAEYSRLEQENITLKNKLRHLEQITSINVPSSLKVASNEEELCRIEIARLYTAAKASPLDFNETKAFEIYVKTLLAIRGKVAEPTKAKESQEKLSHEQLLSLASQVTNDSDNEH